MSEMEVKNKIIELLPKISLLGGIPREDIDFLTDKLEERNYGVGETIFEEGGPPEDYYLILEGEVDISIAGRIVGKIGPGMLFGAGAPIGIQKQLITATAHTDLVLAVIPKMTLFLLEEEKPILFGRIILNVARDLARHLQTLKEIMLTSKENWSQ